MAISVDYSHLNLEEVNSRLTNCQELQDKYRAILNHYKMPLSEYKDYSEKLEQEKVKERFLKLAKNIRLNQKQNVTNRKLAHSF